MHPHQTRDERLTLADLDGLGDSAELRDQVQHLLDAGDGRDHRRPPSHHEGADGSDSVWVSVDARGRVAGVDISRRWRDRLGVGAFAGALFDAYTAAVRKALTAAALAEFSFAENTPAEGHTRPAGLDASASRSTPGSPDDGRDWDDRGWLAATWRTLGEIDDEVAGMARVAATAAESNRTRTLSSPHGYLTLRLKGHGVTGITGDVGRIAAAEAGQLRLDALAAFRAAELAATTD